MDLPGQSDVRGLDGGGVLRHHGTEDGAADHLHLDGAVRDETLHLAQHGAAIFAEVVHALTLDDDGHNLKG